MALIRKPIVKIFDSKKEVALMTDASEHAVAAILSQEGHPIMYLSRKLTSAEADYSNTEKEAFAIVCSTEQARNFLLGKSQTTVLWNLYLTPEGIYQKSHLEF